MSNTLDCFLLKLLFYCSFRAVQLCHAEKPTSIPNSTTSDCVYQIILLQFFYASWFNFFPSWNALILVQVVSFKYKYNVVYHKSRWRHTYSWCGSSGGGYGTPTLLMHCFMDRVCQQQFHSANLKYCYFLNIRQ